MTAQRFHVAESVAEYLVAPSRARLINVLSARDTVERANEKMRRLTAVQCFFPDDVALRAFQRGLVLPASTPPSSATRQWGDFQTPQRLVSQICQYLIDVGVAPRIILEPTYGAGSFILGALEAFPTAELVYGVEIQERHEWTLKVALLNKALRGQCSAARIELHRDDIFTHRFSPDLLTAQDILILGNPPWVTSAELSALDASNVPRKANIKSLNGMDALTGKSNFDLGEFVLLRLLELFAGCRGTLAMLCKNSVIRNVVEALPRRRFKVANLRALSIDAKSEFGAAVDASLLVMDLGLASANHTCQVATLDRPDRVVRAFGWARSRFVSDVANYEHFASIDGESAFVWRQGLKHDCARVMELQERDGCWVNGNGERVEVEEERVYWLLKGSNLQGLEADRAARKILVTQRSLKEDTSHLQQAAPRLWAYLVGHSADLQRRKSSIYRDRQPFSIFGIGEYSFKLYKVAICGLHKEPSFSLVLPVDGRPVMLDDTCYFLGFDTYLDALFTGSLLNTPIVKGFLRSIVFADAKRPYTKEVLMRIDLRQVATEATLGNLRAFWSDIGYVPSVPVGGSDFGEYVSRLLRTHDSHDGAQLELVIPQP